MPSTEFSDAFTWFAIAFLGTMGTARMLRLFIHDTFPPVEWLRMHYLARASEKWGELARCQYCLAPYFAAINMAFAYFTDLHWSWWLCNGLAALSYAAAIVVSYDQPE